MKKLLIALLILGSISSFATPPTENYDDDIANKIYKDIGHEINELFDLQRDAKRLVGPLLDISAMKREVRQLKKIKKISLK